MGQTVFVDSSDELEDSRDVEVRTTLKLLGDWIQTSFAGAWPVQRSTPEQYV